MHTSIRRRRSRRRRTATAVAAGTGLALCLPVVAQAGPPTSISAKAETPGPVAIDSSGNGYVTWGVPSGGDEAVDFCKVPAGGTCTTPLRLPLPPHTGWAALYLDQSFPTVNASTGVVQVVGPSYDAGWVVVWTSTNGGISFGAPVIIPSPSYPDDTNADDVVPVVNASQPSLNYFVLSAHNPGLGYSFTGVGTIGAPDPPSSFAFDTAGVAGQPDDSSVALYGKPTANGQQTITAFSTDADPPQVAYFWSPVPGVSGEPGTLEHGPVRVTAGMNPRLVSGPKGLYLLSEDEGASASAPLNLDVRKWDKTSHTFGAPVRVATVANDINDTNAGGFSEDATTGALAAAWPVDGPGGTYVMRLWTSVNGGASFAGGSKVATIGGAYTGPARMAAAGGSGFLTFEDPGGLELIELSGV